MFKLAGSQIFVLLLLEVVGLASESELFVAFSSLVDELLCASHGDDKELAYKIFGLRYLEHLSSPHCSVVCF